nr:hypothetical protein [Priestia megaterium]
MIKEMKSQGKTIFLTTQYLEEADYLADQIGFLREGEIVANGTPDEMKRLAGADKLLLVFNTHQDTERALKLLESYSPIKRADCEISIDLDEK